MYYSNRPLAELKLKCKTSEFEESTFIQTADNCYMWKDNRQICNP